jgi:hypothetical protein
MKLNKKAITFTALIWMFSGIILFVMALAVLSNEMNNLYGGSNDLTYGIVTNSTYEGLQTLQADLDADVRGSDSGQAGYSSLGILTLTRLPKVLWNLMGVTLSFITGGWINNAVGLLPLGSLGDVIIVLLRIIYTIMIIFIIIKLLTRSAV